MDDYQQRLQLLEGAYACDPIKLRGESILLFDDLYRSGATLKALAQVAYQQGAASRVVVLALTRTKVRKGIIVIPKGSKEV